MAPAAPPAPGAACALSPPLADVCAELVAASAALAGARDLRGRAVLLRADLNVPTTPDGAVADAARIDAALPVIELLAAKGARVAVLSHFGRPDAKARGGAQGGAAGHSLAPVAAVLAARLGPRFVGLAPDCVGPAAAAAVGGLEDGQARARAAHAWGAGGCRAWLPAAERIARQPHTARMPARLLPRRPTHAAPPPPAPPPARQVLLLENVRLHAGETANDAAFAAQLAALGEVYVNDAFGVVHRDQASVTGLAALMPRRYPGPLVAKELTNYLVRGAGGGGPGVALVEPGVGSPRAAPRMPPLDPPVPRAAPRPPGRDGVPAPPAGRGHGRQQGEGQDPRAREPYRQRRRDRRRRAHGLHLPRGAGRERGRDADRGRVGGGDRRTRAPAACWGLAADRCGLLAASAAALGRRQRACCKPAVVKHGSACPPPRLQPARKMIEAAAARGVQLLLPTDALVSLSLDAPVVREGPRGREGRLGAFHGARGGACTPAQDPPPPIPTSAQDMRVVPLTASCCSAEAPCVPPGCFGVDVGPATAEAYRAALGAVNTLLWNGPMGRCAGAGGVCLGGWVPCAKPSAWPAMAAAAVSRPSRPPPLRPTPLPPPARYEVPEFGRGTTAMIETVTAATERGAATTIGGAHCTRLRRGAAGLGGLDACSVLCAAAC